MSGWPNRARMAKLRAAGGCLGSRGDAARRPAGPPFSVSERKTLFKPWFAAYVGLPCCREPPRRTNVAPPGARVGAWGDSRGIGAGASGRDRPTPGPSAASRRRRRLSGNSGYAPAVVSLRFAAPVSFLRVQDAAVVGSLIFPFTFTTEHAYGFLAIHPVRPFRGGGGRLDLQLWLRTRAPARVSSRWRTWARAAEARPVRFAVVYSVVDTRYPDTYRDPGDLDRAPADNSSRPAALAASC